jgi:hypothetical protein
MRYGRLGRPCVRPAEDPLTALRACSLTNAEVPSGTDEVLALDDPVDELQTDAQRMHYISD